MSLVDEIERIIPTTTQGNTDKPTQWQMLEHMESLLGTLGISLETKFEIPLISRLGSLKNEKDTSG